MQNGHKVTLAQNIASVSCFRTQNFINNNSPAYEYRGAKILRIFTISVDYVHPYQYK